MKPFDPRPETSRNPPQSAAAAAGKLPYEKDQDKDDETSPAKSAVIRQFIFILLAATFVLYGAKLLVTPRTTYVEVRENRDPSAEGNFLTRRFCRGMKRAWFCD